MLKIKETTFLFIVILFVGCTSDNIELKQQNIQKQRELGQALFFDPNLSKSRTQSCATCHNPDVAYIDDRDNGVSKMASLGDDGKTLGNVQAPTVIYAMFSPEFHYDKEKKEYIGGQSWDGRTATLAIQAGGPPLNPTVMNMDSKDEIIQRLLENEYYVDIFKSLHGEDVFKDVDFAYEAMTIAIEYFEKTKEFAPFDSKYDRYIRGEYDLTPLEDLGKSLFFSNNNNSCATCHVLKGESKEGETFSNYEYHNIGIPVNHELRAKNNITKIDVGLLANPNVTDIAQRGKYKIPTLRNIAITGPYMHNGVFKELRTVVEFYDKYNNKDRIINPETNKPWAEPEIKETISLKELGGKKLNDRKIDALVAFMKLFTDKRYEDLLEK